MTANLRREEGKEAFTTLSAESMTTSKPYAVVASMFAARACYLEGPPSTFFMQQWEGHLTAFLYHREQNRTTNCATISCQAINLIVITPVHWMMGHDTLLMMGHDTLLPPTIVGKHPLLFLIGRWECRHNASSKSVVIFSGCYIQTALELNPKG